MKKKSNKKAHMPELTNASRAPPPHTHTQTNTNTHKKNYQNKQRRSVLLTLYMYRVKFDITMHVKHKL